MSGDRLIQPPIFSAARNQQFNPQIDMGSVSPQTIGEEGLQPSETVDNGSDGCCVQSGTVDREDCTAC